jgi:isocitrate lyase
MSSLDAEEQKFQQEVAAVKKWWTDSRWRFTKRPFTAEQIVSKRGTLAIEYAGNQQSKKLWKILETRFKACHEQMLPKSLTVGRRTTSATHTAASTRSW